MKAVSMDSGVPKVMTLTSQLRPSRAEPVTCLIVCCRLRTEMIWFTTSGETNTVFSDLLVDSRYILESKTKIATQNPEPKSFDAACFRSCKQFAVSGVNKSLLSRLCFQVGDILRLIPGHCDPTANLHDWLVGLRGDTVETVWPVMARNPGV